MQSENAVINDICLVLTWNSVYEGKDRLDQENDGTGLGSMARENITINLF